MNDYNRMAKKKPCPKCDKEEHNESNARHSIESEEMVTLRKENDTLRKEKMSLLLEVLKYKEEVIQYKDIIATHIERNHELEMKINTNTNTNNNEIVIEALMLNLPRPVLLDSSDPLLLACLTELVGKIGTGVVEHEILRKVVEQTNPGPHC